MQVVLLGVLGIMSRAVPTDWDLGMSLRTRHGRCDGTCGGAAEAEVVASLARRVREDVGAGAEDAATLPTPEHLAVNIAALPRHPCTCTAR